MNTRGERSSSHPRRRKRTNSKLMLIGLATAGILFGGAAGQALGVTPYLRVSERPAVPTQQAGPSVVIHEKETPPPAGVVVPPSASAFPDTSAPPGEDWSLLLVNPWTPLPEGYEVELTQLKNGQAVDSRCYPDLQAMMDACRAAGLTPLICSSYRTQEKQESLFTRQVDKLLARGYSQAEAEQEAGRAVAVPGTSEHQLGLAVDIVDINNQNLNESQENTPVQKWLMEHCWEYGFILRYPQGKSEVTGIIYEPWHYRYVGKTAAQAIKEADCCLEEYLEQ